MNKIIHKIGVYILLCANSRYYIGSTDDIDRRFDEHQRGLVKATRNILPVKLAFLQPCSTLTEAQKLEYKLKTKKSKIIIEKIIKDGYIKFNY